MNERKILFYVLAGLLGGCLPILSINPLATKQTVLFEPALLGAWAEDPNEPQMIWQFRRADEPNDAYELILTGKDGKKGLFIAQAVKLEDQLFLDVWPDKLPCDAEDDPNQVHWFYNAFLFVPAHSFIKIDSLQPNLTMRLTNNDRLKQLLEQDPNAIEHTLVDGRIVLTAPTAKLQKFLLKFADGSRLFVDPFTLRRLEQCKPTVTAAESPRSATTRQ